MSKSNQYHLKLIDFPIPKGKVPLELAGHISERLIKLTTGVVRLAFEGQSERKGKMPEWVRQANDIQLTGIRSKQDTELSLEAPKLGDILISPPDGNMFEEPLAKGDDANESVLGLTIQAFQQAFGQKVITEGRLLDRGVLRRMQELNSLFPSNNASIILHNQKQESRVTITRESLSGLRAIEAAIPAPELVRVSGRLEEMRFTASYTKVLVKGRAIKVHVQPAMLKDLASLFGQVVLVQGIANFNAAQQIASIDAKRIEKASGHGQLEVFGELPTPMNKINGLLDLRKEQSYIGTNVGTLRQLADELDAPGTYEDFLRQLKS